jgi:hypothetical protein
MSSYPPIKQLSYRPFIILFIHIDSYSSEESELRADAFGFPSVQLVTSELQLVSTIQFKLCTQLLQIHFHPTPQP